MCTLFLALFSAAHSGVPHLIPIYFYVCVCVWFVWMGSRSQQQSRRALWVAFPPFSPLGCVRVFQSLMCVLLIHFNACEWGNQYVCVYVRERETEPHGNSSVCQGLCRKKCTQKKRQIKQPPVEKRALILLISHLHWTIVLHMSLSETLKQSHFPWCSALCLRAAEVFR